MPLYDRSGRIMGPPTGVPPRTDRRHGTKPAGISPPAPTRSRTGSPDGDGSNDAGAGVAPAQPAKSSPDVSAAAADPPGPVFTAPKIPIDGLLRAMVRIGER